MPPRKQRKQHRDQLDANDAVAAPDVLAARVDVAAYEHRPDDILTTADFAGEYRIPVGTVRYLRSKGLTQHVSDRDVVTGTPDVVVPPLDAIASQLDPDLADGLPIGLLRTIDRAIRTLEIP